MTRTLRRLCAAAVVAGFGLRAGIAHAADYSNTWPASSNSQVQLVSATDESSVGDPSPARRDYSRAGDSTMMGASLSATYPPQKPALKPATKSTAKPAAKPFNGAPDLTDQRAAGTAKPSSAITRRATTAAQPASPRGSTLVAHRNSELTAHFDVEAEGETPKRPRPPSQPTPLPEAGEGPPPGGDEYGPGCGGYCQCPVWCAGVDYLYLRTHFGNDLAMHELTATTAGATVTDNDRALNFDFGFDSDFRIFVGRRMGDSELRFAYEHIQGDANVTGTADGGFANGSGVAFQGLGGTQVSDAGESVNATSHLHLNLFDIERVQRLDLFGGGDCGSPWDVLWSYGVRIAEVQRSIDEQDPFETVGLNSMFVGAGPRIGLEARRNICGSHFSGFFSANAGLLVGRYRSHFENIVPGVLQTTVTSQDNNLTRVVPNAEMAIGVSWQPTCHTTITSGWMVESFTDAVGSTASTGGCTTCNMINPLAGSGNILSFDGLFIRMEHCF